jgi:hypothetical protein
MADTLKQIDQSILEKIMKIHELVARWSFMTKEEHDQGKIDDNHYEQTRAIKQSIELEIRTIYNDVMEQEKIDDHMKKMYNELEEEFG